MGRRATGTTKSGKFMNPTDQARKEARKRELKKNKKQRKLVRETVLKLKDPIQIIEEMLRLDLLEIEGISHDSLNDKVIAEKKRKLQETLTRILTLYEKQDKEKFEEIKKFQAECERKRHKSYVAYQSQKTKEKEETERKRQEEGSTLLLSDIALPHSGNLAMEEIPLPQSMPGMMGLSLPTVLIPGSSTEENIPQIPGLPPGLIPPGPPPGPPPPASPGYDDDDEEDNRESSTQDYGDAVKEAANSKHKENIGDIDDEDGRAYYSDEDDKDTPSSFRSRKVHFEDEESREYHDAMDEGDDENEDMEEDGTPLTTRKRLLKLAGHDPNQPTSSERMEATDAPAMPGATSRVMPPGPPPGLPPGPPPGLPPRPPPGLPPMGMPSRMPPGMPPPGMRPWGSMGMYGPRVPQHLGPQNVIEKGPEIKKVVEKQGDAPVISAKAQLKNIRAEVTKFVPTAVKIRRNPAAGKAKPQTKVNLNTDKVDSELQNAHKEPTKDAVYAKFMKEMTGFL